MIDRTLILVAGLGWMDTKDGIRLYL